MPKKTQEKIIGQICVYLCFDGINIFLYKKLRLGLSTESFVALFISGTQSFLTEQGI